MKLTPRQKQIYDAVDSDFAWPGQIAARASIRTISPSETAAKYCIQLVKIGLVEKGGTRKYPKWRRRRTP